MLQRITSLFLVLCGGWNMTVAALDADDARRFLIEQIRHGQEWRRVHAAETWLDAGLTVESVIETFREALVAAEPRSPWRVGVLRVLYRADFAERPRFRAELVAIATDPDAPGVVHAVETIGKLRLALLPAEAECFRAYAAEGGPRGDYALMALAAQDDAAAAARLVELLAARNIAAALAFDYIDNWPPNAAPALEAAIEDVAAPIMFRVFAFRAWARKTDYPSTVRTRLRDWLTVENDAGATRFLLLCIGDSGDASASDLTAARFEDPDPSIRIAAAGSHLRLSALPTRK